jgi:hypothetical protein
MPTEPLNRWAKRVREAAQGTLAEAAILATGTATAADDLLRSIKQRTLLWYDYASMYQALRTEEQEIVFRGDLRRLNDIQAGAATLVLAENEDYTRRAWCFLELCGGVRGLMVEITPSWGKGIGAYHNVQRWGYNGDQLIGALVTHGLEAIRGSGLKTTHDSDLPIVAELLSRLPIFGLVRSSGSDLIGGSIPLPRRREGWIVNGVSTPEEVVRDGPAREFGALPDACVLEWARIATAEADGLSGKTGMWIYTSQRVLSLAWAARAAEWLRLANVVTPLDGVTCTWADSLALAEDGRGWARYVPSNVEVLVIVTQADLNKTCLLLDRVQKTHLAAGTTVITVMPDAGRVAVQHPPKQDAAAEIVEADVIVVPRIRRYTAHQQYLLRRQDWELRDVEAMAALRLSPTESAVRSMTPGEALEAGVCRVVTEVKSRLWTASWDVYAQPRLTAKAWSGDPKSVLDQLRIIERLVEMVSGLGGNPFERRQIIYGVLEKLNLTHDEPMTDGILAFVMELCDREER